MGDPGLAGFGQTPHVVGEADYYNATGGEGPPVLLLHGFPQTHFCWRAIAPRLARHHAVVAPDLRGYGASRAPAGGPHGEGFSKREMAGDLVEVMSALAHERFAVVGHDRGARVAYRMALDHPERGARGRPQRCSDYRAVRTDGRGPVAGVLAVVPAGAARSLSGAAPRGRSGRRVGPRVFSLLP
jgi:pimeloyl-ACP methyl ester carboxylesterase